MKSSFCSRSFIIFQMLLLICFNGIANEKLYTEARTFQHKGKYDEAIVGFKNCLLLPIDGDVITSQQITVYSNALVQLMNTFQSKGDPEACISTLQDIFEASPAIQKYCLRDYYSVLGYALSRTENMKDAEETMLKAFTLPLNMPSPERLFRDYAYAAAVFYSNPNYQKEVIYWCQEALEQAQLSKNPSGEQWVLAMLGSQYKRHGYLDKALKLYQQSKEKAQLRNDDLGVVNSLQTLVGLFLEWGIPEYANMYASEAIQVEKKTTNKNPMISAQTYINKGRALYQLGLTDSVSFYIEKARELCQSLPYNSGMVDINLLNGSILTNDINRGGDSLEQGIRDLMNVTGNGTAANRAKAYNQLAQTYFKMGKEIMAERMLDSMCTIISKNYTPSYINIDYEQILNYYLKNRNLDKIGLYMSMLLNERQSFNENKFKFNLVESIADLHTEKEKQKLQILQLEKDNQRLWFMIYMVISFVIISIIVTLLYYQKKRHNKQMKQTNDKLAQLIEKLNQSDAGQMNAAQEIKEYLNDKEKRKELETLTPYILKDEGEAKFRQCFELMYPLFLHRLRERVPSVTPREELLSMLIVLKQDNKRIAELMAIAPRSVLMLRHRFRHKIGMGTELSLEGFIEELLK